jgi:hypothetical protein
MREGIPAPIAAGGSILNPQIIAEVVWQYGPGTFALGAHWGGPGKENYSFVVDQAGYRLTRGSEELETVSEQPEIFDGQPRILALTVEDGTLRGSIDGQQVIEAADENPPLEPGSVTLHTSQAPVHIDTLSVCSASGP